MGPGMRTMARWQKIVFGLLLLIVLAVGAALAWWSARGRDFLWSKIQPRDAALLAGQQIPETLPAEAWAEDLEFLSREIPRRFPDSTRWWTARRSRPRRSTWRPGFPSCRASGRSSS